MELETFCISKYNPQFRNNNKYIMNDWTDFSDIGSIFEGELLTLQKYEEVEQNYIEAVLEIFELSNWSFVLISNIEIYDETVPWKEGQLISKEDISKVMISCLRNKCWCKLENANGYIHFGYDYYMYVGTTLNIDNVKNICQNHSLFASIKMSPYMDLDID